ncbi:hypothetical protein MM300_19575 [Evansella sp. LMS18]|uniref:hypothetical protein n=1 Tax=Evansella sp. LMS18 TaxID=2924033 RepID=UPI0020D13934|nr:hypothetical protein [Evansella sp. LMS18]UTR13103.1 hypothetical protein MM300_19575 [Evansella sp. LMS18]
MAQFEYIVKQTSNLFVTQLKQSQEAENLQLPSKVPVFYHNGSFLSLSLITKGKITIKTRLR